MVSLSESTEESSIRCIVANFLYFLIMHVALQVLIFSKSKLQKCIYFYHILQWYNYELILFLHPFRVISSSIYSNLGSQRRRPFYGLARAAHLSDFLQLHGLGLMIVQILHLQ